MCCWRVFPGLIDVAAALGADWTRLEQVPA